MHLSSNPESARLQNDLGLTVPLVSTTVSSGKCFSLLCLLLQPNLVESLSEGSANSLSVSTKQPKHLELIHDLDSEISHRLFSLCHLFKKNKANKQRRVIVIQISSAA